MLASLFAQDVKSQFRENWEKSRVILTLIDADQFHAPGLLRCPEAIGRLRHEFARPAGGGFGGLRGHRCRGRICFQASHGGTTTAAHGRLGARPQPSHNAAPVSAGRSSRSAQLGGMAVAARWRGPSRMGWGRVISGAVKSWRTARLSVAKHEGLDRAKRQDFFELGQVARAVLRDQQEIPQANRPVPRLPRAETTARTWPDCRSNSDPRTRSSGGAGTCHS
jgi:hypothetical protein